ncbi:hypothetical protein [Haladaptatus sp. NG-SE-30]
MNRIQRVLSLVGVVLFLAGLVVTMGGFDLLTPDATRSSGSVPTTVMDEASGSNTAADTGAETVATSDSEVTQDDGNRETSEEARERDGDEKERKEEKEAEKKERKEEKKEQKEEQKEAKKERKEEQKEEKEERKDEEKEEEKEEDEDG